MGKGRDVLGSEGLEGPSAEDGFLNRPSLLDLTRGIRGSAEVLLRNLSAPGVDGISTDLLRSRTGELGGTGTLLFCGDCKVFKACSMGTRFAGLRGGSFGARSAKSELLVLPSVGSGRCMSRSRAFSGEIEPLATASVIGTRRAGVRVMS